MDNITAAMAKDDEENLHFQLGTTNPTLMDKPFWKYMISNAHLTAFCSGKRGMLPVYCFARFGATQTYLKDGRLICIGGEHEDSYDPDFQIYNDVVVIKNPHIVKSYYSEPPVPRNFLRSNSASHPNSPLRGEMLGTNNVNDVTIYGYPQDVFGPTDFHTATYVRNKDKQKSIYIIGGTCSIYHKDYLRPLCIDNPHPENTRVYRLNLSDFSINKVKMSGDIPKDCCTHKHTAKLLTIGDRQVIEIKISQEEFRNCIKKNGINHPKCYGLDVESGVWSIFNYS